MLEQALSTDSLSGALSSAIHQPIKWVGVARVDYYEGDWSADDIEAGLAGDPIESYQAENLLVNAGIQLLLDLLIGAGGTTYANGNTYIGTGDNNTAAAAGQTDLQAATNRFKRVMDATYPSRSGQTLTFRTTFATSESNYAIEEVGVFNGGPAFATGTMLNRIASSLGTKTSATTLQVTVTVTIS